MSLNGSTAMERSLVAPGAAGTVAAVVAPVWSIAAAKLVANPVAGENLSTGSRASGGAASAGAELVATRGGGENLPPGSGASARATAAATGSERSARRERNGGAG